jgi:hypothetical protein
MKFDWQAYLDGSMPPEQRTVARQELETSAAARAELDGLKSMIEIVRLQGLAEEVPLERLSALIPANEKPARNLMFRWAGALAAVGAIGAGIFFVTRPNVPFDSVEFATSDAALASRWAGHKLAAELPPMDLGGDAPLFYVHEGRGKCCFDYRVDGGVYHVNIRTKPGDGKPTGKDVRLPNGKEALIDRGVWLKQGRYEVFVVGPQPKISVDLASRTSTLLERA